MGNEVVSSKLIGQVVAVVSTLGAKKATKFLSPKLVVKATRHGKYDRRDNSQHIILSIGKPNYAERKFIRQCKLAGEPFPVKNIQTKWAAPDRRRRADRKVKKAA